MDLEELHRQWLMADVEEEEAYSLYDIQDQRYEQEVNRLIHEENMPRTKAEAQVQTEEKQKYENLRHLKRVYKRKLKDMGRKKAKYYHERDLSQGHKLLEFETMRDGV